MKFASEGYLPAVIPAAVGLTAGSLFSWTLGIPLLVAGLLVLLFFRDPHREPAGGPDSIIAPADGRVVEVRASGDGHRLEPSATQRVSIFMSPLDVHVNRAPATGIVERVDYRAGSFRAAYGEHASEVNESNALLIRVTQGFSIVVVQIAGWLARRIICDVASGDRVARGERFGLIMFGSRVDVYLPAEIDVKVREGQRVAAGRTVIAECRAGDAGSAAAPTGEKA